MANNYLQFSVLLPVGAGNVEAALAIYEQMAAACEAEDGAIGFEAERDSPGDDATLWLHDGDGDGDVENVIAFALQCAEALGLEGLWGFRWSLGSSRPRLDAFGGGAQLLDLGRRQSLAWLDCDHWLTLRLGAAERCTVPAAAILQPTAAVAGWAEAMQARVLLDFLDRLVANDPSIADQLRAHLAAAAAEPDARTCHECGEPMFTAEAGTSHHAGDGPDGIDHGRDRNHAAIAEVRPHGAAATRVGRWYAEGSADRPFVPGDEAFGIYKVVSDQADVTGCVTVETPAGQRILVPAALVDAIAAPAATQAGTPPDRPAGHGEQAP